MFQITPETVSLFLSNGGQLHAPVSSLLCGLIFLQAAALAFAGWCISRQRKKYYSLKLDYQMAQRAQSRAEDRSVTLQAQTREAEQQLANTTTTYRLADGPFEDAKLTLDNRVVSVQLLLESSPCRRTICQYSIADRNSLNKPTLALDCTAIEVLPVSHEDLEDEEEAS